MNAPKLVVWPTAFRDMENILNYIKSDDLFAAQALLQEIEQKIAALPEHPKLYRPGRVPGLREMVIKKNYVVVYSENPETITVIRVLHAARQWP
ncbi:MAG: type II toxin-antitoxin system RelE/ParE family toxin [Candidatus Adiutrix sp.]|jgi:addiction module RelE/StbE family toxin|nr:type II toxin-antitoxin system RelE/ParE family toxin [Candidatus Adiutrix sp.]